MTAADIPGALVLSELAGWNQLRTDWNRLARLSPAYCISGYEGDRMVASATLAVYGKKVAWIGMILVHPDCRGKGYGKAIFNAILTCGREAGIPILGLDATDLGRPVYLKFDFEDIEGVDRWGGDLVSNPTLERKSDLVVEEGSSVIDSVVKMDRTAFGISREPLLRDLARSPEVVFRVVKSDERIVGYSFLRPGANASHLGPVIAENAEALEQLFDTASKDLDGRSVFVDVLRNEENEVLCQRYGLQPLRRLTRMSLPKVDPLLSGPGIRAITGFEWG